MNILLTAINAKYIHSNLAVYSLRACAGEYRDAVELAEYTINNQNELHSWRSFIEKARRTLFSMLYMEY